VIRRREFLATSLAATLASGQSRSKIRVGCQTRAYGSPIRDRNKLLPALDDLAAIGYEGFETNFASLEHSFAEPAPMRQEIQKRGIELIGLHLGDRKQIPRVAEATKALGGTHVMLSEPRLPAAAQAQLRLCRELDDAGRLCRQLGIRLCSHNHSHELENAGHQIKTVLAETDPQNVSLVLDVGHVFPSEFGVADIVGKYGSRIAAFHLRDTKAGQEVLMGTGDFDFSALARVLDETRWSGWLIVEINPRSDIPSRKLAQMAREHVRKTMNL